MEKELCVTLVIYKNYALSVYRSVVIN